MPPQRRPNGQFFRLLLWRTAFGPAAEKGRQPFSWPWPSAPSRPSPQPVPFWSSSDPSSCFSCCWVQLRVLASCADGGGCPRRRRQHQSPEIKFELIQLSSVHSCHVAEMKWCRGCFFQFLECRSFIKKSFYERSIRFIYLLIYSYVDHQMKRKRANRAYARGR